MDAMDTTPAYAATCDLAQTVTVVYTDGTTDEWPRACVDACATLVALVADVGEENIDKIPISIDAAQSIKSLLKEVLVGFVTQPVDDRAAWVTAFLAPYVGDDPDRVATLIALATTVNALHCDVVYKACVEALADCIRGREPEAIRQAFRIVNDFTEEEEKAMKAEREYWPPPTAAAPVVA
jgi:hypothetical protein